MAVVKSPKNNKNKKLFQKLFQKKLQKKTMRLNPSYLFKYPIKNKKNDTIKKRRLRKIKRIAPVIENFKLKKNKKLIKRGFIALLPVFV